MNTKKFKERLDVGSNLEDVYRRNGCEYKSDLDPDICHPGLKMNMRSNIRCINCLIKF